MFHHAASELSSTVEHSTTHDSMIVDVEIRISEAPEVGRLLRAFNVHDLFALRQRPYVCDIPSI